MPIISFANQKGGVGKTTSASNVASFLAESGKKVLAVDFDPQANLTSCFGLKVNKNDIYDVLSNKIDLPSSILAIRENLFLIPSNIRLAGASIELIEQENREFVLKDLLLACEKNYDFIVIDCPPSLDLLTINALSTSDLVIVPLQCEYFALEGLSLLVNTVKTIKERFNPNLALKIVLTMYDQRTKLSQEVAKEVVNHFQDLVFKSVIPRSVYLGEAPSNGKTIDIYRPLSSGAEAYKSLTKEVINV